jgi:hypothetical protein
MEIANIQFNWSKLYRIRFGITQEGEVNVEENEMERWCSPLTVFPAFNMLRVGMGRLENCDMNSELLIPW